MNPDMSREDKVRMETAEEEEEVENISSGEDIEMTVDQRKRKRFHRHSSQQIRAMESVFKDCPHPDKKKRNELSQELGMEPLQVKFWFQNKRTQMKAKHQLEENARLMVENKKLKAENDRYREALSNARCPTCGRMATIGDVLLDERHLRVENARLREEIERISTVAANYIGKPFKNSPATPSSSVHHSTALGSGPFFRGSSSKGNGSSKDEEY